MHFDVSAQNYAVLVSEFVRKILARASNCLQSDGAGSRWLKKLTLPKFAGSSLCRTGLFAGSSLCRTNDNPLRSTDPPACAPNTACTFACRATCLPSDPPPNTTYPTRDPSSRATRLARSAARNTSCFAYRPPRLSSCSSHCVPAWTFLRSFLPFYPVIFPDFLCLRKRQWRNQRTINANNCSLARLFKRQWQ